MKCVHRDQEEVDQTRGDVFAMYCNEDDAGNDWPPVFNPSLGLAVEALRHGATIEDLWNVI